MRRISTSFGHTVAPVAYFFDTFKSKCHVKSNKATTMSLDKIRFKIMLTWDRNLSSIIKNHSPRKLFLSFFIFVYNKFHLLTLFQKNPPQNAEDAKGKNARNTSLYSFYTIFRCDKTDKFYKSPLETTILLHRPWYLPNSGRTLI